MNSNPIIPIPCPTVTEWLKRHAVTKLPPGHALGLSEIEPALGRIAVQAGKWVDKIRRENGNEVLARKQKHLRDQNKSAK